MFFGADTPAVSSIVEKNPDFGTQAMRPGGYHDKQLITNDLHRVRVERFSV